MKKIYIIAFAVIIIILSGYQLHKKQLARQQLQHEIQSRTDKNGFINLPINITGQNGVVILAPINCPSERAKKADDLAKQLKSKNIPVNRINSFHISHKISAETTEKQMQQLLDMTQYAINMPAPLVSVNGKLKSDPSVDDIINELKDQRLLP